jgi:leader peptidase (prepilin peptidase)/N-methyltransferase
MTGIAFVLLGTVIGSFLNVLADRLPYGISIVSPPSQCPHCGRRLKPLELIPILSYLLLRGKCITCKATIPIRIMFVELGTGILFGLIWQRYGLSFDTLLGCLFASFLITILLIDLKHHRILNVMTYPAYIIALVTLPLIFGRDLIEVLAGGALGFTLLLIITLIKPKGMGMGDVKLAALIGFVLGYPSVLLALFLSFTVGGLISGVLLIAKVIGRKDQVAFAPYLATGGILTMLYGQEILSWWFSRI